MMDGNSANNSSPEGVIFLKRSKGFLVLILFVICSVLFPTFSSHAATRNIKVGISVNNSSLTLSSRSSITAVDGKGGKWSLGNTVQIAMKSRHLLSVNGKGLNLPVKFYSKTPLVHDKHPYRGYFQVLNAGNGLSLVNILPVEDYLRGVLKMEVNPSWPMEALKAQAIISRTYALRHTGRHSSQGFDVCTSSHCQVYRGINAENSIIDRAIRETEGIVVTYQGKYALTPFHSDSGGATADVSTVWGGQLPYLQGSREPLPSRSPYSTWKVTLSANEISRGLEKKGYKVGAVKSLEIAETDPFGRVNKLTVHGSRGKALLSSNAFRIAVGADKLKSTFFNMDNSRDKYMGTKAETSQKNNDPIDKTTLPAPMLSFVDPSSPQLNPQEDKLLTVLAKQGYFNSDEIIEMLMNPSRKKSLLLKAIERGNSKKKQETRKEVKVNPSGNISSGLDGRFTFIGQGWGHGVGLSQWGAKALADQGWKTRKILAHYFPGTSLKKIY